LKKYLFIAGLFLLSSCAYYNTFFNAKKHYKEAFEKQKKTVKVQGKRLPGDIVKHYNSAIDKSWKVISNYGDSSKYADDALLLIGKCHYNLGEYLQSERIFGQFILKYPESVFIPESKLWLAKSYIANKKDEDALKLLDDLLSEEIDQKIAVQAFYILGNLHYQKEEYEKALEYLEKAIDASSDDELLGNAHYLEGEIYFKLKKYEEAVKQFELLNDLDVPVLKEYEARMQQAEAFIQLKDFTAAENTLKRMLRDIRFSKQFSVIETKLGNLSEIEGDAEYARELYYDIQSKYKKDEGVSLAAYYLAQIYEFNDGDFDSAKVYYAKVRNLKTHEDILKDSKIRAALVNEYLKIRDQIRKDQRDLFALAQGDSSLEDSVEAPPENTEIDQGQEQLKGEIKSSFLAVDKNKDVLSDSLSKNKNEKKKVKKIAVSRTPEQVEKSYKKYSFNKAEFFLLKYQNYDSAAAAYRKYINLFPQDTVLVPKAIYSLYFIYQDLKADTVQTDSLKDILINKYPESPYGLKLRGIIQKEEESVSAEETIFKKRYLKAEDLLDKRQYKAAITEFNKIALQDSGSVWAQKARYAAAYSYEHFLKNVPLAIKAYKQLIKEYPLSTFAKEAKNKIKLPPKEIPSKNEKLATEGTETEMKPEEKTVNKIQLPKNESVIDSVRQKLKIIEEK